MMTDKERIEYVINESGLTYVEFSARTGISPATLSHITSGRSKPTLAIMKGILSGFPDINPEWLFLGSGEFKKGEVDDSSDDNVVVESKQGDSLDLFSSVNEPKPATAVSGRKRNPTLAEPQNSVDITSVIKHTIEAMQRPVRKITEVRIFFDDGTYEAFFTSKG